LGAIFVARDCILVLDVWNPKWYRRISLEVQLNYWIWSSEGNQNYLSNFDSEHGGNTIIYCFIGNIYIQVVANEFVFPGLSKTSKSNSK
jgi:hypothetical protein